MNKQEMNRRVRYEWLNGTANVDCDDNDNIVNATITGRKITEYEEIDGNN